MKIVFMGTPDFAVMPLRELAKKHDVELVVTQEDKKKGRGKKLLPPEVKNEAIALGLDIFQPENINSQESIEKLKKINADIFVVVAFGQILNKEVLDIPKLGAINIHASLLPKLRGAAPINRAIIDGENITGISIMKMAEGLDTGDVALQEIVEIGQMDSIELSKNLSSLGAKLIVEFLDKIEKNDISFTQQDDNKSTYAKKITKETQLINFETMDSETIVRLIRGLQDRGGAFIKYGDERIKVFKADKISNNSNVNPGTVLEDLKIKTIDGAIDIKEIQMPGKKRMDSSSFLLGNKLETEKIGG